MNIVKCSKCGEMKEHQAKGLCNNCYKKYAWQPKKGICKRCKREIKIHAKGYCGGCYNTLFHLDYQKAKNYQKWYGLDMETYKKITEKCVVCDFTKLVSLHHLDNNYKNNDLKNLVGLCPNHHQMLHTIKFYNEVMQVLKEKGYNIPEERKLSLKKDLSPSLP